MEFKKLNKKALKVYYHCGNNEYNDYQYFNFQGRRYRLDNFLRIDRPWFSYEFINQIPDYIHGVYYDNTYYVELIEGYDPKINIYVKSSKGI